MEPEEQPVAPLPVIRAATPQPPDPAVISLRNGQAVRIALFVALLTSFISALSGPVQLLPLIWMLASGWLSVYLYHRRTGQSLSLQSGVRIGGLTGAFTFLIAVVLVTAVVLALRDATMAAALIEQTKQRGVDINARDLIAIFQSPSGIAQILGGTFIVCGLFPTIGGALGAAMMKRS